MDKDKTALERAFEMARSGKYSAVADIKRAVSAEGYSIAQLTGRVLSAQLTQLIREAHGK